MTKITMREAISQALMEEMERVSLSGSCASLPFTVMVMRYSFEKPVLPQRLLEIFDDVFEGFYADGDPDLVFSDPHEGLFVGGIVTFRGAGQAPTSLWISLRARAEKAKFRYFL